MTPDVALALRADRVKGALYGALIADAMAAPTHWFYGGRSQVLREYGKHGIVGYTKPNEHLAGSIMNKSNTGGGGRGGFSEADSIIGRVINHGKLQYWKPGGGVHYHATLKAGESTLEAQLLKLAVNVAAAQGAKGFDQAVFLDEYVRFMTTPGSHNDCYAATAHRMFFANRVRGLPLERCPDNDRHNVDAVDSLTIPIAVSVFASDLAQAQRDVSACVSTIRASPRSVVYAQHFARLLRTTILATDTTPYTKTIQAFSTIPPAQFDAASAVARQAESDEDPVTACYLDQSYPSALFMIYKYAQGLSPASDGAALATAFEGAVLANANRGGENVAQGALVGAMLGAACGYRNLPAHLVKGLGDHAAVEKLLDAFVAASPFVQQGVPAGAES